MTAMSTDRCRWAQEIADLLAVMPSRCAEAVRLSYVDGLSECEIAARMGTSLVEVRGALSDGLRMIGRAVSATR